MPWRRKRAKSESDRKKAQKSTKRQSWLASRISRFASSRIILQLWRQSSSGANAHARSGEHSKGRRPSATGGGGGEHAKGRRPSAAGANEHAKDRRRPSAAGAGDNEKTNGAASQNDASAAVNARRNSYVNRTKSASKKSFDERPNKGGASNKPRSTSTAQVQESSTTNDEKRRHRSSACKLKKGRLALRTAVFSTCSNQVAQQISKFERRVVRL